MGRRRIWLIIIGILIAGVSITWAVERFVSSRGVDTAAVVGFEADALPQGPVDAGNPYAAENKMKAAGTPDPQTPEDAERFELPEKEQKVCIVAQTTFNYNKFKELVEIISKKRYDIVVLNTICNATKERQTEARQIAARVDAMVVIGDKRSSNTQKLFEICKEECLNTYYIQTLDDLDINQLRSVESVGITAGASTPNKIIEEVQNNVRINF